MSVVYFIQSGEGGPIKIGTTTNLLRRLNLLQVGNPVALILLETVAGGRTEEASFHAALRAHRMRSEWFHPTDEVHAVIADAKRGIMPKPARIPPASFSRLATPPFEYGQVRAIMAMLGGRKSVSKTLNIPYTTIASWCDKDIVPTYRRGPLISLASGMSVSLPDGFTDFPARAPSDAARAA